MVERKEKSGIGPEAIPEEFQPWFPTRGRHHRTQEVSKETDLVPCGGEFSCEMLSRFRVAVVVYSNLSKVLYNRIQPNLAKSNLLANLI